MPSMQEAYMAADLERLQQSRNAIIEECARVAETYRNHQIVYPETIAAAIRALKDQ